VVEAAVVDLQVLLAAQVVVVETQTELLLLELQIKVMQVVLEAVLDNMVAVVEVVQEVLA
jgi:hypothetical protein